MKNNLKLQHKERKEMKLKAPFPYFGGKSKIAEIVWKGLGNPVRYIEPFFGSGAVLLARPDSDNLIGYETVNDKDGIICNCWRAIKNKPDETAEYADWPVNHIDLHARRYYIMKHISELTDKLLANEEYCDPKIAGWYIWAASSWIGNGLLTGGKSKKIPELANSRGVNTLGAIPELDHCKTVQKLEAIKENFKLLSDRFYKVQVVCGDWTRVCGGNWQNNKGIVGIFFDPPYSDKANRRKNLYTHDCLNVAHDVRKWSIERGKIKDYRICIAGYFDEHKELLKYGWTYYKWKANGGYSNKGDKNSKGKQNSIKESLFFSPSCLKIDETIIKKEESIQDENENTVMQLVFELE